MNSKAFSLGELLIDMVSPQSDTSLGAARDFVKAPGGAPANVAVGLQRLGIPSGFIGCVGDEPFGHFLRETVEREGVDVEPLKLSSEARTTIAFVATHSDGKKDICFYRNPGADAQLRPEDLPVEELKNAALLHVGSVSLSLEPCRSAQFEAVRIAREGGAIISFDPNWRPSLWDDFELAHELIWQMVPLSHIVKVADEEWEFITGTDNFADGAQKLLSCGPKLVVMTRGADGAAYATDNAAGEVKGHQVEAKDTLGAGDSFIAGLLAEVLRAESLDSFLQQEIVEQGINFANGCGAIATQTTGAIPSLPTRAEVEQFLQSRQTEA